jgi:hypothetical protein
LRLSITPFLTLLPFSLAPPVACQQSQEQTSQSPLEVRVTTPSWDKGYLKFGVDRINHSSTPLYLPSMGMYISVAVNEEAMEKGTTQEARWVNIYGLTDLVSWGAAPIAPGTTIHHDYSVRPTVAVVNLKKETRREIPVRGQLRAEAFYFLSEEDWQKNKHYREEISSAHGKPWTQPESLKPESARAYVEIPCHEVGCAAECSRPPIVLPDERRVVPDIYSFDADVNTRGKAISQSLARKYPVCSEDVPLTD